MDVWWILYGTLCLLWITLRVTCSGFYALESRSDPEYQAITASLWWSCSVFYLSASCSSSLLMLRRGLLEGAILSNFLTLYDWHLKLQRVSSIVEDLSFTKMSVSRVIVRAVVVVLPLNNTRRSCVLHSDDSGPLLQTRYHANNSLRWSHL